MPPKIETLLRDGRIVAAFDTGKSIAQIAAAERLGQNQTRYILRLYGRRGPGARPRPSPALTARLADADWLAAEYTAKNVPQIARELGATRGQVTGALKRAGIRLRSKRAAMLLTRGSVWTPELEQKAAALYREGLTIQAVARELGCSRSSVQVLLAQRGLSRSPSAARLLSLARQRTPQL